MQGVGNGNIVLAQRQNA